ncbi:MAG: radical SAM protein [Chitinophagales bacterium]
MLNTELIQKYNVQGPRYTSYPTVPYWTNNPTNDQWIDHVKKVFHSSNSEEGISLYIHLPYCESLCTFCACNKRITINHAVEKPYIEALLKEWALYLQLFDEKPIIKEIHLGGGTPTFFQPENLHLLLSTIISSSIKHDEAAYSFEAHPKNTTKAHLETLFQLGFKRLSLGIQDFDPEVQRIINRVQPFEMVEEVVNNARDIGYESINFDLIYGLPKQDIDSIKMTIELVNQLVPDRIAFYSYAHVPWIKGGGQRLFTEADLPKDAEKRELYELGKQMFEAADYVEIEWIILRSEKMI